MKRKFWMASTVVLVLVAAGAFYATPYFTLYSMHKAVERRDAAALAQHVDFPALRDDLKTQLTESITRAAGVDGRAGGLAGLGAVVAAGAAKQIVDSLVSPEGVEKMLKGQGNVKQLMALMGRQAAPVDATGGSDAANAAGAADAAPPSLGRKDIRVSYLDWSRVRVARADGAGGALLMRREGLWNWVLFGVELPQKGQ